MANVTIARGKTFHIKELLYGHGFKWNGECHIRKTPMTDVEISELLRKIRRFNHPEFDASKIEIRNINEDWI